MSFLGSIGSLMRGSGLESLFREVYSDNTNSHIMFGKAVSRALRAHFLTEAAFHLLLLNLVFDDMALMLIKMNFEISCMVFYNSQTLKICKRPWILVRVVSRAGLFGSGSGQVWV